jgi:hypothetical protein
MLRSYFLLLISLATILQVTFSNSAPGDDISINFPKNWCDKQHGTATRTTGECICKGQCEGPNCINMQGLSFYSYEKCPTCTCLPGALSNLSAKADQSEEVVNTNSVQNQEEDTENNQGIQYTNKRSGRAQYSNFEEDTGDNEETTLTVMEWIDENGRYVFAFCATLAIFVLIFMLQFVK